MLSTLGQRRKSGRDQICIRQGRAAAVPHTACGRSSPVATVPPSPVPCFRPTRSVIAPGVFGIAPSTPPITGTVSAYPRENSRATAHYRYMRFNQNNSRKKTCANNQIYCKGRLHIPFHKAPVAGGLFLPTTEDSIDEFLVLPSRLEYRLRSRWSGILPEGLAAARIQGDSMNDLGIFHGKIIIFRYSDSLENGDILLIEKLGDEEGTGAWCLKKNNLRASFLQTK